jgi:hypothetical protein
VNEYIPTIKTSRASVSHCVPSSVLSWPAEALRCSAGCAAAACRARWSHNRRLTTAASWTVPNCTNCTNCNQQQHLSRDNGQLGRYDATLFLETPTCSSFTEQCESSLLHFDALRGPGHAAARDASLCLSLPTGCQAAGSLIRPKSRYLRVPTTSQLCHSDDPSLCPQSRGWRGSQKASSATAKTFPSQFRMFPTEATATDTTI